MITKTCPNCFSFFSTRDKRKIYCDRKCQKQAHQKRKRLLTEDTRERERKRTKKENEQSVMLRSIRENRKSSLSDLEKQVAYLKRRNNELKEELAR